jgi:hypothetical protein
MALSITPTDDAVMTAIRTLLLDILISGWEVFRGQANRVPEPAGVNFIVVTPAYRVRLSSNTVTWENVEDPDALAHAHDVEVRVQLDIHGPGGADAATLIATIMRDEWGVDRLKSAGVVPLYANDGHQLPFQNAESQWEDRWVMEAAFQIVPTVSTPAEFAATLTPTINPPLGGP